MTIDQIDWSKLHPYRHDRHKSFETLCYHVAYELYSRLGTFTPIDDTGGGSGVEFYLKLKNGDIWGWQAKYYPGVRQRLTSSRRSKIIDSLKKSTKQYKHSVISNCA